MTESLALLRQGHLWDTEELAQLCNDSRVRELIQESIASYKAGSYRACIVMTWISVVFDFIYKLDELGTNGDGKAKAEVNQFFLWHQNNDVTNLQMFESLILDKAKDDYQFITLREHKELTRLRDDRHQCAHPSIDSTHEPYRPSAELTRYHLRNAVEIMCMHPPTQGKAALNTIWNEIESITFPLDVSRAIRRLKKTPLLRLRDLALRDLIVGMMTSPLKDALAPDQLDRTYVALQAIHSLEPGKVEHWFKERLNGKVVGLADAERHKVFRFLKELPFAICYIDEEELDKLQITVRKLSPLTQNEEIRLASYTKQLYRGAREVALQLNSGELRELISVDPAPQLLKIAIVFLSKVTSFEQAKAAMDELILPFLHLYSTTHFKMVLRAMRTNVQIWGANYYMDSRFREVFKASRGKFNKLRKYWLAVYEQVLAEPLTTLARDWDRFLTVVETEYKLESYRVTKKKLEEDDEDD